VSEEGSECHKQLNVNLSDHLATLIKMVTGSYFFGFNAEAITRNKLYPFNPLSLMTVSCTAVLVGKRRI
jgi:hypothetical protein